MPRLDPDLRDTDLWQEWVEACQRMYERLHRQWREAEEKPAAHE